jgi:hypothetical protein
VSIGEQASEGGRERRGRRKTDVVESEQVHCRQQVSQEAPTKVCKVTYQPEDAGSGRHRDGISQDREARRNEKGYD